MPGKRIVFDGLWRCLCPSVDVKALSKVSQQPSVLPIRMPTILDRSHSAYASPACTRSYRTETMPERVLNKASNLLKMPPRVHRKPTTFVRHPNRRRSRAQDAYERYFDRMAKRLSEIPRALLAGTPPSDSELDRIDTLTLLRALQELLTAQWQYHCIVAIVEHLVAKRGMKPDAFLYECLIKVNVDPKYGSAESVGNLLEEMVSTGCLPNSAVYHGVLEVLAVHPDYVLRTKVLRDMKQAWIEPTFQGLVAIIVGLLRDGQYELALERLEALNTGDMDVPPWLYDIFIYTFTNMGMHAEALMIVQHRLRDPELGVAGNMWYALLEAFSRDSYYDGVSYIWERKVAPAVLVPSDGIVLDVLNTASRNGDAGLAAEALDMLSKRGKKLELHHFEPLMEIHAREHDLKRAFLTLGLMAKTGLQPDSSSTREIYAVLRGSTEKTEEAIAILLEIGINDQVPMAAFNVVLEAKLQHDGFKSGLDTYRSVRRICASPPNLATFHLLLSQCTLLKSLQFILAEMEGFSVKPDSYVYNRTLLICTLNPQYEHAFRYLDLAKSRAIDSEVGDWWMDRDTALALIRRCIIAEDGRVQGLIATCKERGMETIESDVHDLIYRLQKRQGPENDQLQEPDLGAAQTVLPVSPATSVLRAQESSN